MYYDRRVCTKELAERVACVGAEEIGALCRKLINEEKVHVSFWGNVKKIPHINQ